MSDMSHRRWSRVAAAIVFLVSMTIIVADTIRMSIRAREHSMALRTEIEQMPTPAGVESLGVGRFDKARLASAWARYASQATQKQVFEHYRNVFAVRGWRPCDRAVDGTFDHARSVIGPEVLCRNDYRAKLAWPSAEGPGTYSVTLEWNRVTFGIWLIGVALLWAAILSSLVLARGGAIWHSSGRRSSRLRTALSASECSARLTAAATTGDVSFSPKSTNDRAITFGLMMRERRFAKNAYAPYLYGTIAADTSGSGSIVDGHFGFRPETRAVGAMIIIVVMAIFGYSFYENPAQAYEYLLAPILLAIALIIGGRWRRRGDRLGLREFLRINLGERDA